MNKPTVHNLRSRIRAGVGIDPPLDSAVDVVIDRTSKWGNPFRIGPDGTRAEVIIKYAGWIVSIPHLMEALPELAGKRLWCWCDPAPCHGDVLVELVSREHP